VILASSSPYQVIIDHKPHGAAFFQLFCEGSEQQVTEQQDGFLQLLLFRFFFVFQDGIDRVELGDDRLGLPWQGDFLLKVTGFCVDIKIFMLGPIFQEQRTHRTSPSISLLVWNCCNLA
jgi:hypothetical protein